MTIINGKELDAQMGRYIDPNSVPKHNGADAVHMQPVIARGSEQIVQEQGAGRHGAAMLSEQEVGGQDFFGSKTIISVNDAPPLMKEHDPIKKPVTLPVVPMPVKPAAVAGKPKTAQELMAMMGLNKPRMG